MTWKERRKADGYCHKCGKVIESGKTCPECREKLKAYNRVRLAQCKEIGLCVRCMKREPRKGMRECFECAVKRSNWYYEKKGVRA